MVTLADSLVAGYSRVLSLRMRSDLTAKQQIYQGRSYWVVKEPLGLKYFRFQEEEFAILKMLDGASSLDDIKKKFERNFSPQKITYQELQDFIGMLHRSGLVVSSEIGQGAQLRKRGVERRRKERFAQLSNVLAIRYKGIDPERILSRLYPYVAWFFSPVCFALCLLLGFSALTLITVQFDVFRARMPAFQEFFGPSNWLLLAVVLGCTKVLHEFGHGLSCKHFGGECHEMGVMLLVLTPCLYCNVSDSWMLPNKWHRAAIGAAGMYVELMLASTATFLWWFTEPGMINHLCLRIMFISSVSTVLFNANPLLRFDGYYILADVIEIPNLRQKASSVLNHYLCTWCLGMEMPEDPFMPKRNQAFFAMYTIAAVMYRWFIVIAILLMLNKIFEPYGLQVLGRMVAVFALFGLVVMPLWKLWKFFSVPGRMNQIKMPRLYATLGAIVLLIAGIGFLPIPHYVTCSVEIRPRGEKKVYIDVPGRLEKVYVRPGVSVESGQILAELSSIDLDLQLVGLEGELAENDRKLRNLWRKSYTDPTAGAEADLTAQAMLTLEEQLSEKRQDEQRLTLTAPIGGTVIAPPSRPASPTTDIQLPHWSGSPMDGRNGKMYLAAGDLFCEIGDLEQLEASLVIDEGDIELVQEEDSVRIKLDAYANRTLTGQVQAIAKIDLKISPASMSTQAGGSLATRTDPSGAQVPQHTSYQARVPLEDDRHLLQLGMRGRAKVYTGYQPLGRSIWRYLARLLHFEI